MSRRIKGDGLYPEEIEVRQSLSKYVFTENREDFVSTSELFRVYRRFQRGKPTLPRHQFGAALRQVFVVLRENPEWRVKRNGKMGFCCMKKAYVIHQTTTPAPEVPREQAYPEDHDDEAIMA